MLTVFYVSSFLDPVGQVPHKVKEEVAIGDTDDLQNTTTQLLSTKHLVYFI